MKKILNSGNDYVGEGMKGFLAAYSRYYDAIPGTNSLVSKNRRKGKVSLVIGGGSGHDPLFPGFTGKGLADACVNGNIFASPSPQLIVDTAKAVDEGKGVIFLYGNYAGDNLNFDMAEELCEMEDMKTAHVRIRDDVASAPKDRIDDRRGIAGDVYVIKICGAACDAGLPLEEVLRITEKARDNIFSIGLATAPGSIPGVDKPTFELGENEIEFGMGIHGEPGIERTTMKPADQLVDRMYAELLKDAGIKKGEEIAVLVNGLGSTTGLELNTVYKDLDQHLREDGYAVHDAEIRSWCTTQEMAGFSITILRLDDELKKYYDPACYSYAYSREAIS